jgi:hypothetical protein
VAPGTRRRAHSSYSTEGMLQPDSVRERLLPGLRAMLQHQGQRRLRYRLPPSTIYQILDEVKVAGLKPLTMRGPWTVGSVPLGRRGRAGATMVPAVECGAILLRMESEERARELAGLLNWCGVQEGDLAQETS